MRTMLNYRWTLPAMLVLCAVTGCNEDAPKNVAMPPPEVEVSRPLLRTVTDYEEFTGRTDAYDSVQVQARVSGYLAKIHFTDGDEVKKDQLLFEIDDRPYKAQLEQDQASLTNKKAMLDKTHRLYQRTLAMIPNRAASREDLDNQTGDYEIAKAAVKEAEARVRASQLMLDWTKVRAPISGRASRKLITEGNLVTADNTMLTTIVSLERIFVYFYVDERTLLRLRTESSGSSVSAASTAETASSPAPIANAEVGLAYEEGYSLTGPVSFEDNKVDSGTGTIVMRAELKNSKTAAGRWLLSPGLFARVRLPIGGPKQATLVADRALSSDQGKKFVYVVVDKADPKTGTVTPTIERRYILAGGLHGGLHEVLARRGNDPLPANQRLSADDRVVISGLQRVQPGMPVQPKDVPMPGVN